MSTRVDLSNSPVSAYYEDVALKCKGDVGMVHGSLVQCCLLQMTALHGRYNTSPIRCRLCLLSSIYRG